MKELHKNKPSSPNRSTCNICGTDIAGLETLCVECKRIKVGNSYSESLKQQRDDLLEALKRAYFLLEKHKIKDDYFAVLRLKLGDLLPSQIEDVKNLIAAITKCPA